MEKISRIVPTSPRLQAVDMSRERPVRESAPGFGAPVAQSTNRGPKKHAVVEAARVYNETYGADAKMARETEAVKKLADQFFLNQAKAPQQTVAEEIVSETIENQTQAVPEEIIAISNNIPEEEAAPQKPASISVRV